MSSKNDGGPAFPRSETGSAETGQIDPGAEGMSLRDWFAGMAMQGVLAADSVERAGKMDWHYTLARGAYQIADTMLAVQEAEDE